MNHDDRGLVSLPKLVGGPRYTRPPVGLPQTARPPDPDELPLVSERTPEDHALAQELGIGPSPSATHTTAVDAGNGARPNGSWTAADGRAATGRRSLHLGFGLFRGRKDQSGIG